MPDLSLHGVVSIPDAVVFRELDGEAVVLNLDSGVYFGLNAVGTRLWQQIAALGDLQRVHARMLEEYEVPGETLARDLLAFVGELQARGLVALQA